MEKQMYNKGHIRKVKDIMARVMELNNKADRDTFYVFEFTGAVNGVSLAKYHDAGTELETLIHEYAYFGRPRTLHPISVIEKIIAEEERKQKEEQK